MEPRKKLSPGRISSIKRRAGKKSAKNPHNNPVRPQTKTVKYPPQFPQ